METKSKYFPMILTKIYCIPNLYIGMWSGSTYNGKLCPKITQKRQKCMHISSMGYQITRTVAWELQWGVSFLSTISACSITRSVDSPAHSLSLLLTGCKHSMKSLLTSGWVSGSIFIFSRYNTTDFV